MCIRWICSLTDLCAGVALVKEPAEAAIMLEPPRDFKRKRLVDAKLMGYSYLFYGNLISLGTVPSSEPPLKSCELISADLAVGNNQAEK